MRRVAATPVAFLLAALSVGSVKMTPVEKVIEMLKTIKNEVEADGKAEAKTYNKFSCFCKETTEAVSKGIQTGQDEINFKSTSIEEVAANKADSERSLQDKKAHVEQWAGELKDAQARCMADEATYERESAEMTKAIKALKGAIQAMQDSEIKHKKAGLLAVTESLQRNRAEVIDALKLIDAGPRWANLAVLLQEQVDPEDPEYKFHSRGIVALLTKLQEDFGSKKSKMETDYAKNNQACKASVDDFKAKIAQGKSLIEQLRGGIAKLTEDAAKMRGALLQSQASLKEDQLYLKDLTQICEERARIWDQRTQMRSGELKAFTEALSILNGDFDTTVSQRALLLVQFPSEKVAAIQVSRISSSDLADSTDLPKFGGALFLQKQSKVAQRANHEASSLQDNRKRRKRALDHLRREGRRLNSTTLSALALRAAADPFEDVKKLMQRLVQRLLSEATQEATKKGYCNMELKTAKLERSQRYKEVMDLNSELEVLEAKTETLGMEISDLGREVKSLQEALKEATDLRATEKTQNLKNIATADKGLKALTEAIMVLKAFYKGAADSTVVLKTSLSPVDNGVPATGFDGHYQGNQVASQGVLGLLDVIKLDFERTVRLLTETEEQAAAEFVRFDTVTKVNIKGKETKLTLDKEDLSTTGSGIKSKMEEIQNNMNLVDATIKELEALKPSCVDFGMPASKRADKRKKEIEALKKALCDLDPEETEPQCQN